jgi:hypothetical protein
MNIFKSVWKNNSLYSTVLYISRIVYSNPYYVPDVYYLCPDPHVFRTGVKMINMCKKSEPEPKSLELGPLHIYYGPQSFEKWNGSHVKKIVVWDKWVRIVIFENVLISERFSNSW